MWDAWYVDKYVYACVFDVYIPTVCECMYIWDALCMCPKISAVDILAGPLVFLLQLFQNCNSV